MASTVYFLNFLYGADTQLCGVHILICGVHKFWSQEFGVHSLNSHEILFYVMWLAYQPIRMLQISKYLEKTGDLRNFFST